MFGPPNAGRGRAGGRRAHVLGLLVTASLIGFAGCGDDGGGASDSPVAGGDETGGPADLDLGATVYAQRCAVCHGSEGGGGVGTELVGEALLTAYPDREELVAVIEDGKGSMVGLGNVLEPTDTDAVIDYILSFDGSGS